jgi:Zn ribbon nucleic-acid-binding protein
MTNPKMKPCPKCDSADALAVYKYDNGWQHVECDGCFYLGPGSGNRRDAIRLHNSEHEERRNGFLGAPRDPKTNCGAPDTLASQKAEG